LPESFRGGCSFGAGTKADLSRRDGREEIIGGKAGAAKPKPWAINGQLRACGKSMIRLHSFWTPQRPLSKSGFAEIPRYFLIGPT